LRKTLNIIDGEVIILYSGAIIKEKGVDKLVNAFIKIADRNPFLHLVLVGSSNLWGKSSNQEAQTEYESKIFAEVKPIKPTRRIHFIGKISADKMPSVYQSCDIVVLPSSAKRLYPLSYLKVCLWQTGHCIKCWRISRNC